MKSLPIHDHAGLIVCMCCRELLCSRWEKAELPCAAPGGALRIDTSIYHILYTIYNISTHYIPYTTLDTIHCTLHTRHSTLYTLHYALCTCTLYTTHYTLYTLRATLYTTHYTLYTVHYTLYTVHYTLYTIRYTVYTILYIPYSMLYYIMLYYSLRGKLKLLPPIIWHCEWHMMSHLNRMRLIDLIVTSF